jgi:predicted pyridoxine 5'-phosphate oxidase superfamily flavin-nucleotide-binding protein
MTHRFAELMFTPHVQAVQESMGSRAAYARLVKGNLGIPDQLGQAETDFVQARDSLYIATVSENGWPYIQHRGGPKGFVKVLDASTIGFADYRGNKQYVSVGNFATEDRVSLFFMDYPNRRRLKLLGRARIVDPHTEPALMQRLADPTPAKVERGILLTVEAFDWNCPQYIVQRFTIDEIDAVVSPLRAEIEQLRQENARLRTVGNMVLL